MNMKLIGYMKWNKSFVFGQFEKITKMEGKMSRSDVTLAQKMNIVLFKVVFTQFVFICVSLQI